MIADAAFFGRTLGGCDRQPRLSLHDGARRGDTEQACDTEHDLCPLVGNRNDRRGTSSASLNPVYVADDSKPTPSQTDSSLVCPSGFPTSDEFVFVVARLALPPLKMPPGRGS